MELFDAARFDQRLPRPRFAMASALCLDYTTVPEMRELFRAVVIGLRELVSTVNSRRGPSLAAESSASRQDFGSAKHLGPPISSINIVGPFL